MTVAAEPLEVAALIASAEDLYQKNDFKAALGLYGALSQIRPGDASYANRYAACHSALGQFAQAREAWSAAIDKHGKHIGRVNALARACIELRDFRAAQALLSSSADQVQVNANFFVFATIASLGAGDVEQALSNARRVESLGLAENAPALNTLGGLLDRLGRQGHAANVLRLLDLLLPTLVDGRRLLRTGIALSRLLGRCDDRVGYARALIRLEPDHGEGYIEQIRALTDAGRFEECREFRREVDARLPKRCRTPGDDEAIDAEDYRLAMCVIWNDRLSKADDSLTFRALSFRAAAHITLRQYAAAMEVAATGINHHHGHSWFKLLLAKCLEQRGELDSALQWCHEALEQCATPTSGLLNLARIQLRCGLKDAALQTAGALARMHPRLPAVKLLFESLGRTWVDPDMEPIRRLDPPTHAKPTWLHGGDTGDLIYALACMQGMGGGRLHLTCLDGTREPMDDSKIEFLLPLLAAQPYIESVAAWRGEFIDNDLTVVRHGWSRTVDLATQHWWCVSDAEAPDVKTPWLSVPAAAKHGRPVFARTSRYLNPGWDGLWRELKASSPDALFVGTAAEHAEFGHGEHYHARDALDLAQVVQGASVFVGNQSLPYAIAEGLKVGRLLEVSPLVPNCVFPGALALRFPRA
jgi:tetratricopeptide (TPR) repeat protein